jgi:hypothetical protein
MAAFADSDVRLHETQVGDMFGALRACTVDVLLTKFPVREPDLTAGPVLVRETRLLAVSAEHALAFRKTVSHDFVSLQDAPPFESGLVWRTTAETGLVRAFAKSAEAFAPSRDSSWC